MKFKKNHKYDFMCKLCSTGIEGSAQSNRQEISDSNHVTEKNTGVTSCEEVSEIDLVPEVVLEQNPHDPPIKQLDWKTKSQPNISSFSRPYCGPPPLKRAPDTDHKKMGNSHGMRNNPRLETNNGIPRNTPAICAALTPGSQLPPLMPGTFILRNRLTQNKRPSSSSPPISHSLNSYNMAGDKSLVNPPTAIPYMQFPGGSHPPGSTVPSPGMNASIKVMPPPGKNVRAPRFIMPAVSSMNAPTSSTMLQGQSPSSAVQQMKLTPYSSTIVVAQTSPYALNNNNAVIAYRKVNDNVSSNMCASDKMNRQPLKMCDFNIVTANGSNQVSASGAVSNVLSGDGSSLSSESVSDLSSHATKRNQQKNEKHKNDSSVSGQREESDVGTTTKNGKCQLASLKVSDSSESSETSVQGDQYSCSEHSSPLKSNVQDSIASENSQILRTSNRTKEKRNTFCSVDLSDDISLSSLSRNAVTTADFGINKLMWGFDALNLIFEKLPVNDLLRASQVCRSWRNLASQHFLWRKISLRDLKIRNWKRCANALRRYRTSSLDLRGLQHISDSDSTWKEFIAIIKFLKHLEKIVFGQVPPSVIITLSEFLTQLRSLECYCLTEVSEEPELWNSSCTFDFSCIRNLKQLERLRIRSANELKVSSEVLASALCDLPGLQHLSLTSFTNLRGSHFGFLKNLPNLLSLELGDTKNWKSENFAILAELPNLQALRLDNGGDVSDTGLAEAIMRMKDLQELRLINYKIPSNLGPALKKARSLRRLSIWPDNSSEAARVNYNALEAVSKVKKLTYFCWGILISDGSQDLTDGCRPLVEVLKHGGDDEEITLTAENLMHLSSVDLLERLYYLLPSVEVQVECIHRSKFNKYWTVHK